MAEVHHVLLNQRLLAVLQLPRSLGSLFPPTTTAYVRLSALLPHNPTLCHAMQRVRCFGLLGRGCRCSSLRCCVARDCTGAAAYASWLRCTVALGTACGAGWGAAQLLVACIDSDLSVLHGAHQCDPSACRA